MQFHQILKIVFISIQKESIKHAASSNFKDSFYIISERKYVLLKPSVCASRYACRITKVTYLEKFFKKPTNSNAFSIVYVRIFQEKNYYDYSEID